MNLEEEYVDTTSQTHLQVQTILVVDDEAPVCDMAFDTLTHLDFKVTKSTCPVEALQMIIDQPGTYRLVILDLAMPSMSGEQLIRGIHASDPTIRLIVSSGHNSTLPSEELVRMGVVALMPKPWSIEQLVCLVRSALG